MIIDTISKYPRFAFYGAQVVAYGAYIAISHLLGRKPECFIVSSPSGNPSDIDGLPVRSLDVIATDALIIVAVTELLQDEISAVLLSNGYYHTFVLTSGEEYLLMSDYFASIGRFPAAAKTERNTAGFSLYQVRHCLDKPLRHKPELQPWEVPIQAGAELTGISICGLHDNTGGNISAKNRQYCEASVMYWVWKNASAPWVGIEHYRRRLLVRPDMLGDEVDAVLPFPYLCYPNSQAQFLRFVGREVLDALIAAFHALCPGGAEEYGRCLSGKYHYAYNLMAAKYQVFADYCRWAFGIMEYIECLGMQSIKETRALAYISEMLTSIYFLSNQDKLRIRHAEKAIYT